MRTLTEIKNETRLLTNIVLGTMGLEGHGFNKKEIQVIRKRILKKILENPCENQQEKLVDKES